MLWGRWRAPLRALTLATAVAILGAWPVGNRATASDGSNAGPFGSCGRDWDPPERLDDLPDSLLEVSGFVTSARYPDVAWMIRDSDSPSSLYAFTLDGDDPKWVEFDVAGVKNMDWEDITYSLGPDGQGRIWIFENGREDGPKTLYEVLEPDPRRPRTLEVEAAYEVEYPDGRHLNTEAIFGMGQRFAVVSKTRPNRVFRLPGQVSANEVNQLDEDANLEAGSFITATATSADGRLLMTVATNDIVSIFHNDGPPSINAFLDERPIARLSIPNLQFEAGDFFPYDSCDIVLVSEDSSVWRLSNGRKVTPFEDYDRAPTTSTTRPTSPPPPPGGGGPDPGPAPAGPAPADPPARRSGNGYWLLDRNGTVHSFGDAAHFGHPAGTVGNQSTDIEPTPTNDGYWVLHETGRVDAYGTARNLGSVQAGRLAQAERATSLSATPSGQGYWIFTDRGRVLPFGDAAFLGDMGALAINQPVLDSVPTPTGAGYYMVAADGGVFTFGDAAFLGSMGHIRLNAPVRSLVPDPDGSGYWLVASDGGVFTFDAPFLGSMGNTPLNRPISGMAPYGNGYLMVGEDGGVFNFSNVPFSGSLGAAGGEHHITAVGPMR